MPSSSKIQFMKEDHDLEGLVGALRHPGDPILRSDAAKALGELDDLEAVEYLIRAFLQDPDTTVQKAALTALDSLIGSEANLVISTYRSGPPDPESWLQDGLVGATWKKEPVDVFASSDPQSYKIRSLKASRNLDGLIGCLRDPVDILMRDEAALAIGELGNLDGADPLIRSYLEDPNEEVRKVAYQALETLLGSQTDLAIATYRSGPVDSDPWLVDYSHSDEIGAEDNEKWEEVASDELMEYLASDRDETNDKLEVDPEQAQWDRQNLDGLIAVLRNEKDANLHLRAIQALQHSSNIRAISFLAQTALYNDDPTVRTAALTALETRFGDEAAGIIEGYRDVYNSDDEELGDEDNFEAEAEEDEEEEEEDGQSQDSGSAFQKAASFQEYGQPQVIREEKINWRLVLVAGLIMAAAAAVIIILTSHG